ncbi:diguanylate cyclase [Erythrobacter sp. QSSC1-22B]|uniref:sensor domain-containing diguanylate cyclase n=1 Tax=Erythrobacter sp. QSSC1-22B TaxID=1860125 RepID=UPI00143C86AD|nr:diguanylate cyclase [Erythrobacter sp. QSSC1-22B]
MGLYRLLATMVCAFGLLWAAPLAAQPLPLKSLTCTAGAESASAAFDIPRGQLRCSGKRFSHRDRFVRTFVEVPSRLLPGSKGLVWQTEASDFSSMLVRFTYADGTQRLIDVDRQMAARNWFAGNRFSVPIPDEAARLVAVDTVVERPYSAATTAKARILTQARSAEAHYLRSLAYVLVIGLLILPLIYDLLFYRILRQPFVLWHLGMVGAMTCYTLLQSGLIFELLPDLELGLRWRATALAFVLALSSAVMVVRGLIEDRLLSHGINAALIVAAMIPILVKIVALIGGEALRITVNAWLMASLVPSALMVAVAVALALSRGSRGARWAALGLSVLMAVGLLRLLVALGLVEFGFALEDGVFVAMVVLAIFTSLGVGDRFLALRDDRDQARTQAIRLGQMANTDGLTGLANRRAFDMVARLKSGQGLLLADIDRFKAVNDEHGHQVGDAVLCHVAAILRDALNEQSGARVYRLGGEEFAIVADTVDGQELMQLAEKLRLTLIRVDGAESPVDLPAVTVSIGAVMGQGQLMHQAFADADAALYRAKDGGRDCSVLYNAGTAKRHGGRLYDTMDPA